MTPQFRFDPAAYGPEVASLLALAENGWRLMPLAGGVCCLAEKRTQVTSNVFNLFLGSFSQKGALSGLWLYFSCLDEAHSVAQDLPTAEGSFWHAIMHRQEPDPGNSAYWYRRVGTHPVFPRLLDRASSIVAAYPGCGFQPKDRWDPFAFIDFAEMARRNPGSEAERAALEIQLAEWQLLFDYCARPRT